MADTKVSALAALAVEMADTDEIYVNDGGVSKKQAYSVLKAAFATAAQGATAGTALQNVVEDTTPQLGGNLDVQARTITTSTVDGGITLTPNGTGNVTLGTLVLNGDATIGAGQDNHVLTYDHAAATWGPEAGGAGAGDFKADGTVDMTGEFRTDVGTFDSDVADSAAANAYVLNTAATYSTAGANLLQIQNNGTAVFDFSFQGGIDHRNSGATTAAHSQSLNLNWVGSAAQTSSGQYSAVIGRNSTASGTDSIAIGRQNTASNSESIAIGKGNTCSGISSGVFGNTSNATGNGAYAIGYLNNASAINSLALGCGSDTDIAASVAIGGATTAAGYNRGDVQSVVVTATIQTTDVTQTTVLANGGASPLTIPADTTYAFSALVAGRSDEADGNDSAAYRLEGLLARDESNNTVIVGTVTKTVIAESAGATAWDVTAEADDTNEALAIKVTGEAATNIRWVAKVDIAQVTFA